MELPYGFTIEEVKEIVNDWNRIYDGVENNRIDLRRYDDNGNANFDDYWEDEEYIDRYMNVGNAEFCISSEKFDNKETWLSEDIVISKDDGGERFFIDELREMIKGCE